MDLRGRFALLTGALGHVAARLMARTNRNLAVWTVSLGFGPRVGNVELPNGRIMVGWAASIRRQ